MKNVFREDTINLYLSVKAYFESTPLLEK